MAKRAMPKPFIKVRDVLGESNGIISNILMTAVIVIGAYFGDTFNGNVDRINKGVEKLNNSVEELNQSVNDALLKIAVIQEVNERQSEDIKELSYTIKKIDSWQDSHLEKYHTRR